MGLLRKITLLLAVFSALGSPPLHSDGDKEPVDRLLAVVDDDPILESQLEQIIGIGLVEQQEGEDEERFRRRILDGLIEEKLRFHEVDRFEEWTSFESGDKHETTRVRAKVRSTRTTQQLFHVHTLVSASLYGWKETLSNPELMLPPRYRRLLAKDIPEELRPFIYSCFGTQIDEQIWMPDLFR